ncbi:MAG: SPOR domain-containing protein [Elusimicrobia bacterium]|nr:SPOR domain-containing protein [Elusimicrobiota bacterium]
MIPILLFSLFCPILHAAQDAKTEPASQKRVTNYTGFITDASGHPLNGTQRLRFALLKSTGTEPAWSDSLDVEVKSGVFSARLGEGTPLPKEAFDLEYHIEVALAPPAAAPAPAATPAAPGAPKPATRARVVSEEPKPAAQTRAAAGVRYWIQVGSFVDAARAKALAGSLQSSGHSASVSAGWAKGTLYHMVRVGPFESRSQAKAEADKLAAQGTQGILVKK